MGGQKAKTPHWAMYGATEQGFDPEETCYFHMKWEDISRYYTWGWVVGGQRVKTHPTGPCMEPQSRELTRWRVVTSTRNKKLSVGARLGGGGGRMAEGRRVEASLHLG